MHAWRIVDLRAYLAKKNHGYSIPAKSYDFCPHLTQLDILDFTLSPNLFTLLLPVNRLGNITFYYKLYRISDDLLIQRNKKVSAAPQRFYSSE